MIGAVVLVIASGILAYALVKGDDKATADHPTAGTTTTTKNTATSPKGTISTLTTRNTLTGGVGVPGGVQATSAVSAPTVSTADYCTLIESTDTDTRLKTLDPTNVSDQRYLIQTFHHIVDASPSPVTDDWSTLTKALRRGLRGQTGGVDNTLVTTASHNIKQEVQSDCGYTLSGGVFS